MATVTGYTAAKIDQLIAGVSGGSGVELVSGVVNLDETGSPVREFYCTSAATIEGVAFAAGTTVVFRRTLANAWGYIIVDDWVAVGGATTSTTTLTTTTATTTTTTTTPTGLAAAILALSPVGYWKLNETTGTTATDYSGNNRHGTYVGGITLNSASYNNFPSFPGAVGAYVEILDNSAFSISTTPGLTWFSLTYWLNDAVMPPNQYIAKKGISSGNYEYAHLLSTGKPQLSIWDTTGTPINSKVATNAITWDAWHAIITTTDGVSGSSGSGINLYKDSNTPLAATGGGAGGTYTNGSAVLRLGESLKGSLGHIAVFPGALSTAQISGLISAAQTEGLIP